MWGQEEERHAVVVERFQTIGGDVLWNALKTCFDSIDEEHVVAAFVSGRRDRISAAMRDIVAAADDHSRGHGGLLFALRGSIMTILVTTAQERGRGRFPWSSFRIAIFGMQELVRAMLYLSDEDRGEFMRSRWGEGVGRKIWHRSMRGALVSAHLIFALDCYGLRVVEPLPESDGDLKVDYVVMLGGDGDDEIALQIKSAGRTRLFVVPERTSRKSNDEGAFCRGVHRYRQMRRAETGRSDMDVLPVIARISTDLQNGAGLSNSEVFLAVRDLVNRYVGEEEVSAVI